MHPRRPVLLSIALALGGTIGAQQLSQADPVMVDPTKASPLRPDPGRGICATVVHVTPASGVTPFSNVNDAIAKISLNIGQGMVDDKVSAVFASTNFRNGDAALNGDFGRDGKQVFPFSDDPLALHRKDDRNFAARVRGYVSVSPAITYTNAVLAYDGERLTVGGQLVTQADERVAARELRQVNYSAPGLYPIELIYYMNGSAAILEASVSPTKEQEGPAGALDKTKFKLIPSEQLYTSRYGMTEKCIECNDDMTCGPANFCAHDWPGQNPDGLCAPCVTTDHCGPMCMRCDATSPICDGSGCVQCLTDGDCGCGRTCDPGKKICTDATICHLDADCPSGKRCDPDFGTCVAPQPSCTADKQCSAGQVCDLQNAKCVKTCKDDTQCSSCQRCNKALGRCQLKPPPRYVGGCSAASAPGGGAGPGMPGLLAVFGVLLGLGLGKGRRRRLLFIIPAAFFFLVPGSARADISANSQTFHPAVGPENILTVEGSRTPGQWKPMVVGLFEFSYRPLRLIDPETKDVLANTVSSITSLHIMGGLGFTSWLSLGLDLPVVLYQGFDRNTPITDVPNEPSKFGVGDFRMIAKVRLINNTAGGFGLAFVPQVTFPTGKGSELRGDDSFGIEPRFALDYRTEGGTIIALNVGFLGRTSDQVVRDMKVSSQVRYGLGAFLPLPADFGIYGEIAGGTSIKSVPDGSIYTPLEGHLGGRWVHRSGINVNLGVGTGFTDAVGSPQVRVFASLGYLPMDRQASPPPNRARLEVDKAGTGTGVVISDPPGIKCGQECGAEYHPGTYVTLRATPDDTSTFAGWTGPCSGLDPCTVAVTELTKVGAEFAHKSERSTLTVEKKGSGTGIVTTDPEGIVCGVHCSAAFRMGQQVKLTAKADKGSRFIGWEGPCSGHETCVVDIGPEPPHISAIFNEIPHPVPQPCEKIDLKGRKVFFETAKSTIKPDSFYLLDDIAELLKQNPEIHLRVEGHTDNVPFRAPGGNTKLSQDRAESVRRYLIDNGKIPGDRLISQGFGEGRPVASNKTEEGRYQNRRTDFVSVGKECPDAGQSARPGQAR